MLSAGALDSGVLEVDSGMLEVDSVTLEVDSETLEVDSGVLEVDSGVLEVDSGMLEVDSVSLEVDSDELALDSVTLEVDSGVIELDSGKLVLDSGKLALDSVLSLQPQSNMADTASAAISAEMCFLIIVLKCVKKRLIRASQSSPYHRAACRTECPSSCHRGAESACLSYCCRFP